MISCQTVKKLPVHFRINWNQSMMPIANTKNLKV